MRQIFSGLLAMLAILALFGFAEVKLEKEGIVLKIDRVENHLILKTSRGDETLLIDSNTKGLAHAKEGAKVFVRFSEKTGEPRVLEILPHPPVQEEAPH